MQRQHDYSNVKTHDEHYDDASSSTEVESLVGAEKQWRSDDYNHTAPRSRRRISKLVASLKWVLVIALQLVIVGLLARDQGLLDKAKWGGRSTSAKDVGGDITGWGPHSTSSDLSIQSVS